MTLHVYNDLVQGSDEWLEVRRGIVTSSVISGLVTAKTIKPASNVHSRAIAVRLVAERITGWAETPYTDFDMLRGTLDEPVARDLYAEHFTRDPVEEVGFMVRDDWGFKIGYSPDGLVAERGLIEIKSRRPKQHLATILDGEVPAENMAQIQCGLLVSGREWCDYVSYCGGMPMWRKCVVPDEQWHESIVEAVEAFEDTAAIMIAKYHYAVRGLPETERGTYDLEMRV